MGDAVQSRLRVLGRQAELADLERVLGPGEGTRALLLVGEAGIGKTTVWAAGVDAAAQQGMQVLSVRAAAAEEEFSFAGLADLLSGIEGDALAGLPAVQRRALEAALLRADPDDAPTGARAVATALLGVLRDLAANRPLFVAVDDVQWLDLASAQALAFAARRLERDEVRFVLARRAGDSSVLEAAFAPSELARIELTPLTFGALQSLLAERLGLGLPRRVMRQVVEASGGNPFFALELGRLLLERGIPKAGEELPVPTAGEDLVGARVTRLPRATFRALLAVALSPGLSRDQLASLVGEGPLDDAFGTAVLVLDGERIRPAHPLLASTARGRASPRERQALHRELAAVLVGKELQARHLALGTDLPDGAAAATLVAASRKAAARGAATDAVDLAAHALRLTPVGTDEWVEHVLVLAERLLVAGEHERASELLTSELPRLPAGTPRARAHLLLADTDSGLAHLDERVKNLQRSLAERPADPGLRAIAAARWSHYLTVLRVEQLDEAERRALEALPDALLAGPVVEREVLFALACARKLRGHPIDDIGARFEGASSDAFLIRRGVRARRRRAARYARPHRRGAPRPRAAARARGGTRRGVVVDLAAISALRARASCGRVARGSRAAR